MYFGRLLFAVLSIGLASLTSAHDFVNEHSCIKPYFAIDYDDEEQLAQLDRQVFAYKECLGEFARFQLNQVKAHSDVSSAAMKDLREIADEVLEHAPEELIEKWKAEYNADEP